MGIDPVDIDLMVSGIHEHQAKAAFSQFGEVAEADLISNAPVFLAKVAGFEFDVAMARIEVDTEPGKHGFEFFAHPSISALEDAERRDFTIGAMMFDLVSGMIFDPFDGQSDLENGIIRHCSDKHFVQSPERVLRGCSQAARFGFLIHPDTVVLMKSMKQDFHTIPVEQIWRHFEKAAKKATKPELFWSFLTLTEWAEFFPELQSIAPAAALLQVQAGSVPHFVAALIAGMSFVEENRFFDRIGCPKAIRKQAVDIKHFGPDGRPEQWVFGRDVADFIDPGPKMGEAVRWAFIGQINGQFRDKAEAIEWLRENF